jgi:hypothetical protein
MSTRSTAIAAGLAAYIALVLVLYSLHRLAFGSGGGPYPLWYSVGELLLNSLMAVVPGLVVGWLRQEHRVRSCNVALFPPKNTGSGLAM